MIIGIDSSRLNSKQPTGVEVYSTQIISALLNIDSNDKYIFYSKSKLPEFSKLRKITWEIINQNLLWTQLGLSRRLTQKHCRPDILFVPSHVPPYFCSVPYIVTIHDISWKIFPRAYSIFQKIYLNLTTRRSVRKSLAIIVPSEYTKNQLIKYYNVPPNKIYVIPHGINIPDFETTNPGIEKPYILYTGRLELKKNILTMIDGYILLRKEKSISPQLILVGKHGYGYENILQKVQSLSPEIKDDIKILNYVEERLYYSILRNSSMVVVPCPYEGFGLPALEAMLTGVPVVAANGGALPEIVYKAGILVDPFKPFEFAAAFSKLLHQPKYAQSLVKLGKDRVKDYSWNIAAQKIINLMHKLYEE